MNRFLILSLLVGVCLADSFVHKPHIPHNPHKSIHKPIHKPHNPYKSHGGDFGSPFGTNFGSVVHKPHSSPYKAHDPYKSHKPQPHYGSVAIGNQNFNLAGPHKKYSPYH